MRSILKAFGLLIFVASVTPVLAQRQSATETAASLRVQLADVQARQSELQQRLQELDEALKPENIQNSLAGVGSVHPETLREQRKRQLEKEKTGVKTELEQLSTSQRRLEKAIGDADAAAYQQSAAPDIPGNGPNANSGENTSKPKSKTTRHRSRRLKSKKSNP
jgi:chaperonin cofactor prefoldin